MANEPEDRWLTLTDAAAALCITRQAVAHRIKRGTLQIRTNNKGKRLVRILATVPVTVASATVAANACPPGHRQSLQDSPEPGSPPSHQPDSERLQAALSATVAALQGQVEQLRSDMASERHRHDAEFTRFTSHWQERCDRAEIMADDANAALRQLVEAALRLPEPSKSVTWPTWVRRLFGSSKRSNIGG